jgi:hypothetical protein
MNIYFVDLENVGLKALQSLDVSFSDKVFVFSNSGEVKKYCDQSLYFCLSDYPTGSNQADFYIIAYLSKVIEQLSKAERLVSELVLCTKDNSLIVAFEYQCNLNGIRCSSPFKVEKPSNVVSISKTDPSGNVILSLLAKPKPATELLEQSQLSKPDFTTAFNLLIKEDKVKRSKKSKKLWVLASTG